MPARVIVLAGPSGAGKSRLAERSGLPVLRLDDFYKSGADPGLPVIASGPNRGETDWDDPASWLPEEALEAIRALCLDGTAGVPVYEIARNGRCGTRTLDLAGARCFLAEGLFAQDIVAACADAGLLAAALCVRQHPVLTFWRRLTRDLREHRKPPLLLVRRGWALLRAQGSVVADAVAKGCEPVDPETALARIRAVAAGPPGSPADPAPWRQPDRRTCGAAAAVRARMLTDASYDAAIRSAPDPGARFAAETLATHRRLGALRATPGGWQMPWPRALGTSPWALARLLTGSVAPGGVRYRVRPARTPARRRRAWATTRHAVTSATPLPVAVYVGSPRLPRHVLLVHASDPGTGDALAYDPATGEEDRRLAAADVTGGRLPRGRWRTPWLVVAPGPIRRRPSAGVTAPGRG